jgi:hypothetical protein
VLAGPLKAWAAIDIAPESRLANPFPKEVEKASPRYHAFRGREDVGVRGRSQRSARAGELPLEVKASGGGEQSRSDPAREASNLAGRSSCEPVKPRNWSPA